MARTTRPPGPDLTSRQTLIKPGDGVSDTHPIRNGYVTEEAAPHTVRVRPSAWQAFEAVLRRADLKKGPAVDALVDLVNTGDIDVKLVRQRIKEIRGVDIDDQESAG